MPPRRAAAVSAATSLSMNSSSAGPSTSAPSTPSKPAAKGRASGGQQNEVIPIAPVSEPVSPIIRRLRTMWKFAAVCQFLFTFDEAFGMGGFETEALELDLDGTEKKVIPDLMRRLLYTLTLNRSIDETNWEDHLRAQYLARQPEENHLGTSEEPFPWAGLPLREKVETLYQACEWQLWDAERFRKLVKNDDDAQVWRIDPVGWDSQDNTYWLFDDNRLWIQHPKPAPVKAKAPAKKNSKKAKAEAAAARRAAQNSQKRKREEPKAKNTPTRTSTRNRASSGAVVEEPVAKKGRSSRRSIAKDGWEEIPPGLLYEAQGDSRARDDDDGSELSDPPPPDETASTAEEVKEEEGEGEGEENGNGNRKTGDETAEDREEEMDVDAEGGEGAEEVNGKTEAESDKPRGVEEEEWIEFETLAVTKQEWVAMESKFAKSKHPDERLLHQFLKGEVLPKVMADIAEAEKQRAHEAAMANRKRSSRIALKESEREEKERDRVARYKMEEKMAAIRAEESQRELKEKEELDTAKLREERMREREERIAAREREAIERVERDIMERENREKMREMRKMKREQLLANGGLTSESEELQQHKEQDNDSWELKCEVCGKAGINLDDIDEIVCCEKCGVWQHTECWNTFDRQVGQAARDWEKEDFFCSSCKPPAPGQPWPQVAKPSRVDEEQASTIASAPVVPSQPLGPHLHAGRPAQPQGPKPAGPDVQAAFPPQPQGPKPAGQHLQTGHPPQSPGPKPAGPNVKAGFPPQPPLPKPAGPQLQAGFPPRRPEVNSAAAPSPATFFQQRPAPPQYSHQPQYPVGQQYGQQQQQRVPPPPPLASQGHGSGMAYGYPPSVGYPNQSNGHHAAGANMQGVQRPAPVTQPHNPPQHVQRPAPVANLQRPANGPNIQRPVPAANVQRPATIPNIQRSAPVASMQRPAPAPSPSKPLQQQQHNLPRPSQPSSQHSPVINTLPTSLNGNKTVEERGDRQGIHPESPSSQPPPRPPQPFSESQRPPPPPSSSEPHQPNTSSGQQHL